MVKIGENAEYSPRPPRPMHLFLPHLNPKIEKRKIYTVDSRSIPGTGFNTVVLGVRDKSKLLNALWTDSKVVVYCSCECTPHFQQPTPKSACSLTSSFLFFSAQADVSKDSLYHFVVCFRERDKQLKSGGGGRGERRVLDRSMPA